MNHFLNKKELTLSHAFKTIEENQKILRKALVTNSKFDLLSESDKNQYTKYQNMHENMKMQLKNADLSVQLSNHLIEVYDEYIEVLEELYTKLSEFSAESVDPSGYIDLDDSDFYDGFRIWCSEITLLFQKVLQFPCTQVFGEKRVFYDNNNDYFQPTFNFTSTFNNFECVKQCFKSSFIKNKIKTDTFEWNIRNLDNNPHNDPELSNIFPTDPNHFCNLLNLDISQNTNNFLILLSEAIQAISFHLTKVKHNKMLTQSDNISAKSIQESTIRSIGFLEVRLDEFSIDEEELSSAIEDGNNLKKTIRNLPPIYSSGTYSKKSNQYYNLKI